MKLHRLLQHLPPFPPLYDGDLEITSIENDHRKVRNGSLFICVKGYTVDGHDFAASAVENGAVAILAQRELDLDVPVLVVGDVSRAMAVLADVFYGQPSHHLQLIGVTGTNGKTTTSHIIEKILADANRKTGLIGTMYTKIGEKTIEAKNTTPESLTLQKTFKQMVDEGIHSAVMEVSSHALDLGRVHGSDYNIAVFTNLTQDHLDYHKTMEEYRRAKGLLFSQLGNTFDTKSPKFAVINVDDEAANEYIKSTAAHIITYGIDNKADLQARNIQLTASGTTFDLHTPIGIQKVSIQLIGKFNVYNVLASIGAAIASGLSYKQIIQSVEKIKGVSGRFELVDAGQPFAVIVDYAHTPDSLENVLNTIRQFAKKKVFVVVGCGGDRDRMKRPIMAQIASDLASNPIFTSDNPRSEDPREILKDMEQGAKGKAYQVIEDRKAAIFYAVQKAEPGDIILIAGKGHETYQQIGKNIYPFDDRIIAKEAIKERQECI